MSITSFDLSDLHKTVEATSVDGNKITFLVEHTPAFLHMFTNTKISPPHIKKEPTAIVDIRGASDGANSLIRMQWNRIASPGEKEFARVRETPTELLQIFKEAGLCSPKVTRSVGCILRDARDSLSTLAVTLQL